MAKPLTYSLITPVRDEEANLRRLAACVTAQRLAPLEWVIVDDGSTDGSVAVAHELRQQHRWVTDVTASASNTDGNVASGRRTGRDVVAFTTGVAALSAKPDIVLKLDADVSFAPDFFERLVAEFATDPTLGIAGGLCYEEDAEGRWRAVAVTGDHVRGATRAYRWQCLVQVVPLETQLGWDGVDEVKARLAGWSTRTFASLPFRHHRPLAFRDGSRARAWAGQGRASHFIGYRPSYLLLRALHRCRSEPAAIALVWGYAAAAATSQPRIRDRGVRTYIRRQQRLREVRRRFREARGSV